MKNPMQLKALVRNISREKNISAQLVLQNYMLERLLERISLSKYRNQFILKGGFLIASIVGLDTRATMDMDLTIKGFTPAMENIQQILTEITNTVVEDNVTFAWKGISEIREDAEYAGYRVALTGNFPPMEVPLKLDITSGDKITPKEVNYEYKPLFGEKVIPVLAYNLETVLAEKLEAIVSRGDQSTRMRDYYDVYILNKLQSANIDLDNLKKALENTAVQRGTFGIMTSYKEIIQSVGNSESMNRQWQNYQVSFDYAKDIEFGYICEVLDEILDELFHRRGGVHASN